MIRFLSIFFSLSTLIYCQHRQVDAPINSDGRTLTFHLFHWSNNTSKASPLNLKATDIANAASKHHSSAAVSIKPTSDDQTLPKLLSQLPLIIHNKQINTALTPDTGHSRRTYLLTDKKSHWAIGYAPSVSRSQLASALLYICKESRQQYTHAYLLNSGSTAAFWVRNGSYNAFHLKGVQSPQTILSIHKK